MGETCGYCGETKDRMALVLRGDSGSTMGETCGYCGETKDRMALVLRGDSGSASINGVELDRSCCLDCLEEMAPGTVVPPTDREPDPGACIVCRRSAGPLAVTTEGGLLCPYCTPRPLRCGRCGRTEDEVAEPFGIVVESGTTAKVMGFCSPCWESTRSAGG